ncbi:MAG: hypothetical protein ACE5OT_01300 [Candidatus Hadarchaeaceae archaeon]
MRISAWKQGARQRLREKGPHVKKRRVTEVVEFPKLVEKVSDGPKSPPLVLRPTFI